MFVIICLLSPDTGARQATVGFGSFRGAQSSVDLPVRDVAPLTAFAINTVFPLPGKSVYVGFKARLSTRGLCILRLTIGFSSLKNFDVNFS